MLPYFVVLLFLPLCTLVSGATNVEDQHTLTSISKGSTSPTASSRPSNDESRNRQTGTPWMTEQRERFHQTIAERRLGVAAGLVPKVKGAGWTGAQREKYRMTIATRTVTDEMQANWTSGRRKGSETRQRAEAMGLQDKGKRKQWTQERRDKFNQTIASRVRTDAMRATSTSKGMTGKQHSDETKFLISMRKLGVGLLPSNDLKRMRSPKVGGVQSTERRHGPYTEAAREAMSAAAKERWAKVRANQRQELAEEASTSMQV